MFIGQIEKGFDFLDYHFGSDDLTVVQFVEPRAKGSSSDDVSQSVAGGAFPELGGSGESTGAGDGAEGVGNEWQ